ncbi:multicopper oxidase family protein [Amycolatopsis magusensis]|uniref:Multicopper oxidase CueO n=1 Tax=Amycolatopsis magusensis TaxID=882444 RepID=A0ABS4Q211_9PSEU|nr:multicopper oxidase family protein [Amycolatopsis magusensis]MBP2185722.1 spore coat protein A [Amycolatopsis magusensis]
MSALSRRRFLGLTGGAGVLLAAGLTGPRLFGSAATGELLTSEIPLPAPFQVPLPIPAVLASVARDADADRYEIVQRPAIVEILPGVRTPIWGYQGTFPGPTIESRSGRTTIVRHRNELPVPTVVHLHGGRTPPEHDGYATDLVLPAGGRYTAHAGKHDPDARLSHGARDYVYPLQQKASLLWYHDHRMDFTGPAVYRGLAGLHVVRDDEEDALPLPRGDRELPLVLTDRAFAADGSLRYPSVDQTLSSVPGVEEPYVEGVFGDVLLVNGAPWPVAEVSATRHRLRILNASNARRYDLALDPPPPGGGSFTQIGSDQGLLAAPVVHDHVPIAPAERYDLVADFGRYPVGTEVTLVNRLGTGTMAHVMRFRIVRSGVEDSHIPDRLGEIEPLDRARATVVRDFSFRSGKVGGRHGWTIGGQPYSPTRMDARPRLGDVEIWRFVADLHHPIHLHLVHFHVLSRGGREPGPYDAGRKDTVDLRPGEAVEVIARFDGYRGRYTFHCHNAEHEDMGMMANFETT